MGSARETDLTLREVAMLADGADLTAETAAKLAVLVRSCPLFAEQIEQLQAMAEVAGTAFLEDGLAAHRGFDQLMAAQWEHPDEVLGPHEGILYPQMIAMAEARARQAQGEERRRLLEVQERLEQAAGERSEVPVALRAWFIET